MQAEEPSRRWRCWLGRTEILSGGYYNRKLFSCNSAIIFEQLIINSPSCFSSLFSSVLLASADHMPHTHSLLHLFIMYRVLLRLCHAFVWSGIENLRKVSYSSTIIGSSFTFCSVCISLPDCLLCRIFDFSLPSIENPKKSLLLVNNDWIVFHPLLNLYQSALFSFVLDVRFLLETGF